jgi:hypothetical protein
MVVYQKSLTPETQLALSQRRARSRLRPDTGGQRKNIEGCARGVGRLSDDGQVETIGFNDLMNIYRRACHPENVDTNPICTEEQEVVFDSCYIPDLNCGDSIAVERKETSPGQIVTYSSNGRPTYWRDFHDGSRFSQGGFYDGAVRIWGEDLGSPALDVGTLGDEHAVSDGSER